MSPLFRLSLLTSLACGLAVWLGLQPAYGAEAKFTSFEARQTHSLALTPDGTRLLALNSIAASLSVFDATTATPTLLFEIPVGLEPVAVRARSNDEAWVVSEVGDSVAVVSLSKRVVVATLGVGDEPGDLVFAGGKAFVTCARDRLLYVFNAATRQALPSIPLAGMDPRALAVNAAGTKIYAGFLHSGNQTTIIPRENAPPQPEPANNEGLSPGPNVALIAPSNDSRVPFTLLDRDVAEIDVASSAVTYYGGTGTTIFDVAINPVTGNLWVANTEAINLIHFESNLRGHFIDSRLTKLQLGTGTKTIYDLNAGTDYSTLPNPAAQAINLAQPTGLTFTADGSAVWMAAFATDRVAKVSTANGQILQRIDVRTGGGTSAKMRGPRALVLHPSQPRLFVLNKLSDTLTTITTDTGTVLAEVPLSPKDTMPANLRQGRGFLFDARLSGNSTVACASCHIDADRDGLAWDLGDQEGDEFFVYGKNLSRLHDNTLYKRPLHPLKGAMVTQTLRGMVDGAPFHWRGDRPTIQDFNPTFNALMGGSMIASADMDNLASYLLSLRNHPNPNRTKTNGLPATFQAGNPARGLILFQDVNNHCGLCHALPAGSDRNVDDKDEVSSSQFIKNPPLATSYQRTVFNPTAGGQTLTGFGMLHDGTGSILPTVHPYSLDTLSQTNSIEEALQNFRDVAAFVLCFESGTTPAVGDSITVSTANASDAAATISRLEGLPLDSGDLVATGMINGVAQRFTFSRALNLYISENPNVPPMTRSFLLDGLGTDGVLTFKGVPPGEALRFSGAQNTLMAVAPDSFFTKSTKGLLKIASTLSVLSNDPGTAVGTDQAAIVNPPASGTLTLSDDTSLTYQPSAAFATTLLDSFDYRVLIKKSTTNTLGPVSATISTYAQAAGKYLGLVEVGGETQAAGYVTVSVTSAGSFSGSVLLGTQKLPIKGKVEANGNLKIAGKTAFPLSLTLHALKTGERNLTVSLQSPTVLAVGTLARVPFSKTSPVPNAGKHLLTLTPGTATGTAPTTPGTATLVLGKTGSATLTGKLGDGTAFSFAGSLSAHGAGGWSLDVFTKAYKSPAGPLSGVLLYDPAQPSAITGTLRVVEPPQTKKGPYADGFTLDYTISVAP